MNTNVTIDVKVLIQKLQHYNGHLDLDGVKAYLFDLIVGGEPALEQSMPDTSTKRGEAIAKNIEAPFEHATVLPPAEAIPEVVPGIRSIEDLLPKAGEPFVPAAGKSVVIRKTIVTGDSSQGFVLPTGSPVVASSKRAEREARRQRAAEYSDMDTKTMLRKLSENDGKKTENGQFTDFGSDAAGPAESGDVEI